MVEIISTLQLVPSENAQKKSNSVLRLLIKLQLFGIKTGLIRLAGESRLVKKIYNKTILLIWLVINVHVVSWF